MTHRRFPVLKTVVLASVLAACAGAGDSEAGMPCHEAQRRVQAYFARIKAFADREAYRNIPMRCGPNMQCGQWWIGRLNVWFGRQIERVQFWHVEIDRQCMSPIPMPAPAPTSSPVPAPRPRSPWPEPMQTVQIDIPTTPEGFRP